MLAGEKSQRGEQEKGNQKGNRGREKRSLVSPKKVQKEPRDLEGSSLQVASIGPQKGLERGGKVPPFESRDMEQLSGLESKQPSESLLRMG